MEFQAFLPTKILFGNKFLSKITEFKHLLGKRVFIVTGKRSTKESGALSILIDYINKINVDFVLFDKVYPNPDVNLIEEGGIKFLENSCESIIAIGGGSSIDTAKAIGAYTIKKEIVPYLTGEKVLNTKIPRLIAIPTTSGTGSEVTKYSIIIHENKKVALSSELIIPDLAILDPSLTFSMPENIVRDTGLDALSHALEGLFSLLSTSYSDLFGYEALKIIFNYLKRSFVDKNDFEAREYMHYAAMLAGIQINHSGTGLVHAMGYPLTVKYGFPHGYANALLMPYVFKYELPFVKEKMAKIVRILNLSTDHIDKDAQKLVELIFNFNLSLNIPPNLKEANVDLKDLDIFSEEVFKNERLKRLAPKAPTYKEILDIYKNAYFGVL